MADGALLVVGGDVVTMAPGREVVAGATVAVVDGAIADLGAVDRLRAAYPDADELDARDCVVVPGLVNGHQHHTGDPLVRSCIPDLVTSEVAIFDWAVPVHGAHDGDDDEVAATLTALQCLRSGTTTVVEAGTVAHPERVAAGMERAGVRGTIGRWGWDVDDVPFSGRVDEVIADQRAVLDRWPRGGRIEGWVTLVGHDLASDELLRAAADLARDTDTNLTMHLSPHRGDTAAYLARTGRTPVRHLAELGVLGPHLLLAHGVWLGHEEVELVLEHDVAVAACPWAYLRLGQGILRAGRHHELVERGGRVCLGCDAANASDHHDIFSAAALLAGIARDGRLEPLAFGADTAFALATIDGARAIGMEDRIGSIEVGKRADLVVIDTSRVEWQPRGDLALQLVWGGAGRHVRDVIVDGDVVLRDGRSTRVDESALVAEAADRQRSLVERSGVRPTPTWPIVAPDG
ncbi:MAG: amidohydrolase family protein [Actinomycetota bacterium]